MVSARCIPQILRIFSIPEKFGKGGCGLARLGDFLQFASKKTSFYSGLRNIKATAGLIVQTINTIATQRSRQTIDCARGV